MLSTNGEKYMEALPKLIKDCIGDAPLTVRLDLPLPRFVKLICRDRSGLRRCDERYRLRLCCRTIN